MLDQAFMLIRKAIDLYPKKRTCTTLWVSFTCGKEKALASYQKALEIDPNFPNAPAARQVVKKLSEELVQKQ